MRLKKLLALSLLSLTLTSCNTTISPLKFEEATSVNAFIENCTIEVEYFDYSNGSFIKNWKDVLSIDNAYALYSRYYFIDDAYKLYDQFLYHYEENSGSKYYYEQERYSEEDPYSESISSSYAKMYSTIDNYVLPNLIYAYELFTYYKESQKYVFIDTISSSIHSSHFYNKIALSFKNNYLTTIENIHYLTYGIEDKYIVTFTNYGKTKVN